MRRSAAERQYEYAIVVRGPMLAFTRAALSHYLQTLPGVGVVFSHNEAVLGATRRCPSCVSFLTGTRAPSTLCWRHRRRGSASAIATPSERLPFTVCAAPSTAGDRGGCLCTGPTRRLCSARSSTVRRTKTTRYTVVDGTHSSPTSPVLPRHSRRPHRQPGLSHRLPEASKGILVDWGCARCRFR